MNGAPLRLLCLALPALLPLACGSSPGEAPSPPGQVLQSNKERIRSPQVSQADLTQLADGNTAFACDLYGILREEGGNLFYSPFSISQALAMTYAGARGETERQMAQALHFTLPQDRLHPAFNAVDLALASRGQGAQGQDGKGFRLHIANAIWGQTGYPFLAPFLDTLALNYGAGLRLLDFQWAAELARITINDWVAEQTEDKIKDLIPPGALDDLTRLVLTNAIYFNAAWAYPFEERNTKPGPFHRLDGSTVTVPLMSQTEQIGYARGEGWQAVELPYDGLELSMVIILPEEGRFAEMEGDWGSERLSAIVQSIQGHNVRLTMPRFRFEAQCSLRDALAKLGMPVAFTNQADFSGMSDERDLFISDVLHKAFVSVDEKGTEAAAATAVIVGTTSVPPPPVAVTIDRPFLFLIRDLGTKTVLFVGRVLDPSA